VDNPELQNPRPARPHHRRRSALMVTAVAVVAVGCGGAASSLPQPPTTATVSGPRPASAAFVWLRDKAEPWNHALNADQRAVIVAGGTINKSSSADYFSRLGSACSAMLHDAQKGRNIPHSPSAAVDGAWEAMLTETETYASDCLTLVRTGSGRDLNTWNNSLTAMNQASGAWNTVVAAVRAGGSGSSG
jgi:hypothetical protein